jgi:hypothetical protein
MKTVELTGALLDYWVARATELSRPRIEFGYCRIDWNNFSDTRDEWGELSETFSPSTDWEQGGPIIESFDGHIWHSGSLIAKIGGKRIHMVGKTILIASMRAKVASVYGNELPDKPPDT